MGAIIAVEPQVVVLADVTGLGHRFGLPGVAGHSCEFQILQVAPRVTPDFIIGNGRQPVGIESQTAIAAAGYAVIDRFHLPGIVIEARIFQEVNRVDAVVFFDSGGH